jgi:hypothetical protein
MADTASKLSWGPLLWRLFHNLAELSNRRDIPFLWPKLLQLTAALMPCDACRVHLAATLRSRPFFRISRIDLITGPAVQTQIRGEVWRLHNEVNARLGKPMFSLADVVAVYGVNVAAGRTRAVLLSEIAVVLEKLRRAWTPLLYGKIDAGVYMAWRGHVALMVALVSAGGTA